MITELNADIQKLQAEIEGKKAALSVLIQQKKEQETILYPMSKFLHQTYIYDRPQKWNSPKVGIFDKENLENLKYLAFNGVVSGSVLNNLYEKEVFTNEFQYATFVIADYDHFDDGANYQEGYIGIHDIYELLAMKVE